MNKPLFFSRGNAKLDKSTLTFSLPAGHACPFAKDCRSCVHRETGKIQDGPHAKIRCYATTAEALFRNIRESRWNNFELLKAAKTTPGMVALIETELKRRKAAKMVRIHQSGDFFNLAYFDAWLEVARRFPHLIFYGYTKALPFWAKRRDCIPANMQLTASEGGTHDHLIKLLKLRSAKVVFSEQAAADLGLEIDHDDTHCWKSKKSFAILLHGTQPAGSEAGKTWYKIFKHGRGGYKSDYFAHYEKAEKARQAAIFTRKFAFLRSGGLVLA